MVAQHRRTLRNGSEYARHFPLGNLLRTDPIVIQAGDTFDTIREMDKLIRQYQSDTASVAPKLRGATLEATCRNIWEFCYHHFQYRLDKAGVEQLRRPLRAWKDRTTGIDCDCYSILVSTILLNLNIPHKLRKAKYQNKPEYQHIYVVVPTGAGSAYYTIDPVVDAFNREHPYTGKHDLDMMPIQVLNGIGSAPATNRRTPAPRLSFGAEFVPLGALAAGGLSGLGAVTASDYSPQDVMQVAAALGSSPQEAAAHMGEVAAVSDTLLLAVHDNLENTRREILRIKEVSLYPLADAIKAVLAVWDRPAERDLLIGQLAATGSGQYNKMAKLGVPLAPSAVAVGVPMGGLFDSIGDFFGDVGGAIKQATSWVGSQATTAAHAVGQAGSWVGSQVASGATAAWSGVAQAGSWVGNQVASGATAAWSGIKQASAWVATQAVAIGKLVLKYNPLSILIRAGLRVAFRVNLFYMSERLAVGYATDEQARAAGLDMGQFQKAKDRLQSVISLFNGLQGDENLLRESILAGNAHANSPVRIPGLQGLGCPCQESLKGLGEPATAVSTAAASGVIATILNWLKGVDWKALFKTAGAVASAIASKFARTPTPSGTAMLPLTEQEYAANQSRYDNPPQSGPSPILLAGGAAVVAFILLS